MAIHGHRGSRGTHSENTFAAFSEAVASKADFIELDVQACRNEIPVVIHDPELDPRHYSMLDGGPLPAICPVALLTHEELAMVNACTLHPAEFPEQKSSPAEPIRTLDEVCHWLKANNSATRLNIEIKREAPKGRPDLKPDAARIAKVVVDCVHRSGRIRETILQSFDASVMKEVFRLAPEGFRSMLFERETDYIAAGRDVGATILGPRFDLLNSKLIDQFHKEGFQVVPWTVNEPNQWRQLIDWGVDGIITDYPRKLRVFLERSCK